MFFALVSGLKILNLPVPSCKTPISPLVIPLEISPTCIVLALNVDTVKIFVLALYAKLPSANN